MSAKITLIGQPQSLRVERDNVTFKIITGPASNTAPKGLPLFKAVTYIVQCNQRQLNRGRVDEHDKSELIIEGYQEPRADADGKPYIAVVAMAISSKALQGQRKLEQIREETIKAEEAYDQACEKYGIDSAEAEVASAAFEKLKGNLLKFMSSQAK
jgi:TfoX/Sxy family transcriptional regulator of competence genes